MTPYVVIGDFSPKKTGISFRNTPTSTDFRLQRLNRLR